MHYCSQCSEELICFLQSLIEPYNPICALRSPNTGLLTEPLLKTPGQQFTRPRLLSLLASKLWRKLLVLLRSVDSLPSFRLGLKTHLFGLQLSLYENLYENKFKCCPFRGEKHINTDASFLFQNQGCVFIEMLDHIPT